MGGEEAIIVEEAARLAAALPTSVLRSLAEAIRTCDLMGGPGESSRIIQNIPQAQHRGLVGGFLERWRFQAPGVERGAVSLALRTAAHVEQAHRAHEGVELVWTGPELDGVPFRCTEQAILQVIESATRRLLVISYAVFNIPRICEALVRAAGRGVALTVVVETGEPQAGREVYDTLRALGPAVACRSSVYVWPHEQRARDRNGRAGILHVKCVVGDGRWLFLSSANLTEYALTINMELGVLVTGGPMPAQIVEHFDRMIETGLLEKT